MYDNFDIIKVVYNDSDIDDVVFEVAEECVKDYVKTNPDITIDESSVINVNITDCLLRSYYDYGKGILRQIRRKEKYNGGDISVYLYKIIEHYKYKPSYLYHIYAINDWDDKTNILARAKHIEVNNWQNLTLIGKLYYWICRIIFHNKIDCVEPYRF